MRTFFASSLLVFAVTASAADRAFADPHDWNGFYAGAHLGKSWGETGNSWRNATPWVPDGDISYDSVSGGLHVGHLWQYGALVFGIEGDYSWASLKGDDTQFAGLVNAIEMDYVATIRGRLGFASGRSLIYATGGIAFSELDKKDLSLGNSASNDLVGWTVGAGYEHALWGGWRARAEYQYIDFGSTVSALVYEHRADDLTIHSVRGGVSYGF